MVLNIVLISMGAYVFLVFGVSRFVVPFLGFSKDGLPEELPDELNEAIMRIKEESGNNKEKFIQKSYEYITKNFRVTGPFVDFPSLFWHKPQHMLENRNRMHCTQLNYLLRLMLVNSGMFDDKDIKQRITTTRLCIHQYLKVKLNGKWIDADPWAGVAKKIPLGKHSWI